MGTKLTPEEEAELAALESEVGSKPADGGLTPEEEAELAQLEADEENTPADVPQNIGPRGEPIPKTGMAEGLEYALDSIPIVGPAIGRAAAGSDKARAERDQRLSDFADENPATSIALPVAGAVGAGLLTRKVAPGAVGKILDATGAKGIAARAGTSAGVVGADSFARGRDAEESGMSAGIAGAMSLGLDAAGGGIGALAKGIRRYMMKVPDDLKKSYEANRAGVNKVDLEDNFTQRKLSEDISSSQRSLADRVKERSDYESTIKNAELSKDLPREIMDDYYALQKRVSEESSGAYGALEGKSIDSINSLRDDLNKLKMRNEGVLFKNDANKIIDGYQRHLFEIKANTPEAKDFYRSVKETDPEKADQLFYEFVDDMDAPYSAVGIKDFIQKQIDDDANKAYMASQSTFDKSRASYVTPEQRVLMSARQTYDERLKDIPEYAEAMKPVAEETSILKNFRNVAPNVGRAYKVLQKMDDPIYAAERKAILDLGNKSGKDYGKQVSEYEMKKTLKNDSEKMGQYLRKQFPDLSPDQIDPVILQKALNTTNPENLMMAATKPTKENARDKAVLDVLGKRSGRNFQQEAEELSIAKALQNTPQTGSREYQLMRDITRGLTGGAIGFASGADPTYGLASGIAGMYLGANSRKAWKNYSDIANFLKTTPGFRETGRVIQHLINTSPESVGVTLNQMMAKDKNLQNALMGKDTEE